MKSNLIRAIAVTAVLLLSLSAMAQNRNVTGTVTDASDGQPVIGAGVTLPNGVGTITDIDGKYVIAVPDKGAVITISSLGYKPVTVEVGARTVVNVELQPDSEALEEVVVLGFTSQKRSELTSAVVSMDGNQLTDVTSPDVGNMLQGKVAGVMVSNSSGQPGANADIRIRGTGSITAGAGPLYVVDGVAGGSFNPNDIETLTVLKDASATALYGAAAAGGVIVITTKSGKQDKVSVNFKASAGIKKALTGRFRPMDAYEMYDFLSAIYTKDEMKENAPAYDDLANYNFNWIDNVFRIGVVQNYYASVSGKMGRVGYYASLDHYNERGTLINSGFRRTTGRLNLTAPITDRLNLTARVTYAKSHTDQARWRTRESSYVMLPFDNPYALDDEGNRTKDPVLIIGHKRPDKGKKPWYSANTYNIFHNEKYNYAMDRGESFTADLQLVWNPFDWLTITSTTRYDSSNSYGEEYMDPRTTEVDDGKGMLTNSDAEAYGWGTTNLAKFHKIFGDSHDVNAIIGWEFGGGYERYMKVRGQNMPAGQRSLSNCSPDTVMMDPDSPSYDFKSRAWALLGQAQYSYLGKYILTASIRYDESYKFGPYNRGGFFPGVSGAWVASGENFLKNNKVLTFLKLRAGFGKTGNNSIPPFQYQDTFALTAQYNNVVSAFLERQANYKLGWEEAYMTSVGVDATFIDNWNLTLDFYHTINDKLLLDKPMPPSSGFFSMMDNVGKVRNMGIELAVDGDIIRKRDFAWHFSANVGVNQNRVLELPEHKDMPLQRSDVTQMVIEGRDIYSWYMPKWVGVDYETGRPLWEKLIYDDNGKLLETRYVDTYGEATPQVCGSASPWLTGGFGTSISWKGITLSATGTFIYGNKVFNRTRMGIMDTDGAQLGYNQQSLNNGLGWYRWQKPEGTEEEQAAIIERNKYATHPQALNGGNYLAHYYSSRYLEDGSFFRLRNVTLSYDFPDKWMKKAKMGGARIYVSADNVLTLTRFSGMDPEVGLETDTYSLAGLYSDNYPVPMTVVMGIDITF